MKLVKYVVFVIPSIGFAATSQDLMRALANQKVRVIPGVNYTAEQDTLSPFVAQFDKKGRSWVERGRFDDKPTKADVTLISARGKHVRFKTSFVHNGVNYTTYAACEKRNAVCDYAFFAKKADNVAKVARGIMQFKDKNTFAKLS